MGWNRSFVPMGLGLALACGRAPGAEWSEPTLPSPSVDAAVGRVQAPGAPVRPSVRPSGQYPAGPQFFVPSMGPGAPGAGASAMGPGGAGPGAAGAESGAAGLGAAASPFGPGGAASPYGPGGPASPFGPGGAGSPFATPAGGGLTPSPAFSAGQGGGLGGESGTLNPTMIGDSGGAGNLVHAQQAVGSNQFPSAPPPPQPFPPGQTPSLPDTRKLSAFVPAVRGLKIAENQSPRPQDRVFFSFNYFSDVNGPLNRRFDSPVDRLRVYRYTWGFEKTFADGNGSVGVRVPLNTLTSDSTIKGNFAKPGGTSTALGDLTLFTKYILAQDRATGSLISVGMAVTPPTGPSTFAGAKYLNTIHTTEIQPFLGYLLNRGNFYLHGFTALDAPVNPSQATLLYNDVGVGYFIYRTNEVDRILTGIAPTFEAHVTTPLNHRDFTNQNDPGSFYDVVNLTYGVNFEFFHRGLLTLGYVAPVTGPRPFDGEALILFNIRFGGSPVARRPPPVISG